MKTFIVGLTCLSFCATPAVNVKRINAVNYDAALGNYLASVSHDEKRSWGDTWKPAVVELVTGEAAMPDGFELIRSQFDKFSYGWMSAKKGRRSFICAEEAAADAWAYSKRAA